MPPRRLPRWTKTKTENSTRTNYVRNLAEANPDDPVEENGPIYADPAGVTDPIPAGAILAVGQISAVPAGIVPTANAVDPAKATSRAPSAAMPKKSLSTRAAFEPPFFCACNLSPSHPSAKLQPIRTPMKSILCSLFAIALAATAADKSANWPQWRGPNGDGSAPGETAPTTWSDSKNLKWKLKLPGSGASSPIVWNDRVYITSYSGYGAGRGGGNSRDLKRHVVCADAKTGKLWFGKRNSRQPPR